MNIILLILLLFPINIHSKIKQFYTSEKIDYEKPIITKDYIFYVSGNYIKAKNLKDSSKGQKIFGETYRRPLRHLWHKDMDFVFFTKDCRLEVYENKGISTLSSSILYSKRFSELEDTSCYDTLNFDIREDIEYIASYNTNNNKIIVDKLQINYKYKFEEKNIAKFEAKTNICQALIYRSGVDDMILIGITNLKMYFWIVKGIFSWKDIFISKREALNIEENFNCGVKGKDIAGLIGSGKKNLLYISDSVYLFDMDKLEKISKFDDIKKPSSLSVLNYRAALIGNESGYVFYVILKNQNLKIADKKQVCDTEIVKISYDNAYYYLYENVYTNPEFVVQCKDKKGGYYYIILKLTEEGIEDL